MKNLQNFLLLFLVGVVFFSCSRNPVTGKREVVFMSESQEIALGASSDPMIVSQYGMYQNTTLQNFINAKGKEMGAISHRPNLEYDFKILDSPVVNAFALPGGYVYFTRGILAHFNNEAEFAGVLGHEIGHITARHGVQQQSKQVLGQAVFMGGVILSETVRNNAQDLSQGLGLLFLKFGRDDESQSDQLGVEYSTKVGYDSYNMANFFNTLKAMRGDAGAIPTFMSTHPDPGDRYNNVNALTKVAQANDPRTSYVTGTDSYLAMIDGLIYGDDPRQGYVENNNFYHPELKFSFQVPAGWQLLNSPAQVQMGPADGKGIVIFTLAEGTDLNATAQKLVEENEFQVLDQSQNNVNGMPSIQLLSQQTQAAANGQAAQTIKILTYLIQYDGRIYLFHGISQQADFAGISRTFESSMRSFNKLTDQSKINKLPTRIAIKTVRSNMTLKAALESYSMKSADMNTLALLNGKALNDQVKSGSKIKVFKS